MSVWLLNNKYSNRTAQKLRLVFSDGKAVFDCHEICRNHCNFMSCISCNFEFCHHFGGFCFYFCFLLLLIKLNATKSKTRQNDQLEQAINYFEATV